MQPTHIPGENRSTAVPLRGWAVLVLVITTSHGCRAIRQHVESRQGIVGRKLSREGLEAIHEGRWETAEARFLAALELNPADDRAHGGLAETLWERGERERAIEHMEQAVRLSGSDPQLVVRMGRMYFDVGRVEDAQKQSEELLESGRAIAATWLLRGDVMAALGADDEALAAYHRSLVLQPEYPASQVAIADVYYRHARYDRCLATLDRLRDHLDSSACPLRGERLRGMALVAVGRPREAADCFQALSEREPGDADLLLWLAEAELAAGDLPAARQAASRALQIDADHPAARALVARIEDDPRPRLTR